MLIDVDTTQWGRVPTNFSIVEAFDNDPIIKRVSRCWFRWFKK